MDLDESVYPDREPPRELETLAAKADYVQRICGAFDFGIPPEEPTIRLFSAWKEVFDVYPLAHSPAYHAFRACFGWEPVARLPYLGEPGYVTLDAAEGRTDGCEDAV